MFATQCNKPRVFSLLKASFKCEEAHLIYMAQQHIDLVIATESWCWLRRQVCVCRLSSIKGNFYLVLSLFRAG